MTTLKTIITTLAESAAESARRKALEALGVPIHICDECRWECKERRREDDGRLICLVCVSGLEQDATALVTELRANLATAVSELATVTAERDNLRQHIAMTTRGDGLDDLRVRLANAAIAYIEEPEDAKAHEASRRRDHLCAELDAALRAKSEVAT